jgi:hypothetical protein
VSKLTVILHRERRRHNLEILSLMLSGFARP